MSRPLLLMIAALITCVSIGIAIAGAPAPAPAPVADADADGEADDVELPDIDTALVDALDWLADHQKADGSWSATDFATAGGSRDRTGRYGNADGTPDTGWDAVDTGVSALALLAFLGAGYTHISGDSDDNDYAATVAAAVANLSSLQASDGCLSPRDDTHFMYNHAFATFALAEAYGMTGDETLEPVVESAVAFIDNAQNRDDSGRNGWRYGIRAGDTDASVTGVCALALKSARIAGIEVDTACFDGAIRALDALTDADEEYRTGYMTRGGPNARLRERVDYATNPCMDAINVTVRLLLGHSRDTEMIATQIARMTDEDNLPTTDNTTLVDYYYWYYGSLATFQMGEEAWDAWRPALETALLGSQCRDKDNTATFGSWDSIDAWGPAGGRVYATAINALSLETAYRYERMNGGDDDDQDDSEGDDSDDN